MVNLTALARDLGQEPAADVLTLFGGMADAGQGAGRLMLSYEEAAAAVTAPGERFEIEVVDVDGVPTKVFKHAPPSLREVFATARARGDEIFLVYEDERWTFTEVMRHVDALAALLVDRYGVQPGDRVAVGMRNYPEWVISFAAITSIGAISVSLNAWWTEDELDYALDGLRRHGAHRRRRARAARPGVGRRGSAAASCRSAPTRCPHGVDRWEDVRDLDAPMPDVTVTPDMDATILYTSGTTGHPKGAVSTHRAVIHALMGFGCKAALDKLRRPDDAEPAGQPTFILIVPLFHVTGLRARDAVVLRQRPEARDDVQVGRRPRPRADRAGAGHQLRRRARPRAGTCSSRRASRTTDTSSLISVGGGGAPGAARAGEAGGVELQGAASRASATG